MQELIHERVTADELAQFALFQEDTRETLEWLAENLRVVTFDNGSLVVKEGDVADQFVIILGGEIHFGWASEGYRTAFVGKAGDAVGVLPFSRMKVHRGRGLAVGRTRLAQMHVSQLRELIYRAPALTQKLVNEMTDRTREATRFDERKNKMLALGKLSAGLAHELNNPASAAVRSSTRLREALLERRRQAATFRAFTITPEAGRLLSAFNEQLADCLSSPAKWDGLERADREADMSEWLESVGVPVYLAPDLVDAGVDLEKLKLLLGMLDPDAVTPGLKILVADFQILCLTRELEEASKRILDLVQSVKKYSYMDRAPLSHVNVEEGVEVTLRMFQHQTKHGVEVHKNFAGNLPIITANGSELNQVWTNLIDNALDAMCENGTREKILTLRTALEPDYILVEVTDTGSGISSDVQSRIFEPFFTTKPVGEGTGLGLDIVRRIVENHKGTIHVESRPGRTVFQVRIPLNLN